MRLKDCNVGVRVQVWYDCLTIQDGPATGRTTTTATFGGSSRIGNYLLVWKKADGGIPSYVWEIWHYPSSEPAIADMRAQGYDYGYWVSDIECVVAPSTPNAAHGIEPLDGWKSKDDISMPAQDIAINTTLPPVDEQPAFDFDAYNYGIKKGNR